MSTDKGRSVTCAKKWHSNIIFTHDILNVICFYFLYFELKDRLVTYKSTYFTLHFSICNTTWSGGFHFSSLVLRLLNGF